MLPELEEHGGDGIEGRSLKLRSGDQGHAGRSCDGTMEVKITMIQEAPVCRMWFVPEMYGIEDAIRHDGRGFEDIKRRFDGVDRGIRFGLKSLFRIRIRTEVSKLD